MKGRFIVLSIILAMVVITWQHGKNRALIQLLDNCEQQDATHVDNIFDLQQLNANLLDDVLTLELDNAVLNDSIDKLNK